MFAKQKMNALAVCEMKLNVVEKILFNYAIDRILEVQERESTYAYANNCYKLW